MSLFAVKNDKGEWLSFDPSHESLWHTNNPTFFNDKSYAEAQNTGLDGSHVVELVEAPEKVVLTEEQDEIVKGAHKAIWPANYISCLEDSSEQRLLISAYVNGYTVAKEKKYNVKVPLVQAQGGLWFFINSDDKLDATWLQELAKKFTMDEIEENGLQDCEKMEVEQDAE